MMLYKEKDLFSDIPRIIYSEKRLLLLLFFVTNSMIFTGFFNRVASPVPVRVLQPFMVLLLQ
jgi:hypothetical protein